MSPIDIRPIASGELAEAARLLAQLRAAHAPDELLRRIRLQQGLGYRLLGAFEDGALVGVLGMRPVHTLARGAHLHVDDLVVDSTRRARGIGRDLLLEAERIAASDGRESVFLDSREDALGFYRRLGYEPHTAVLVRKRLPGPLAPR